MEPQPIAELPTPNLPLLRKVLDHIDAHPEEWDQTLWACPTACGTAFCVAGHALTMSGYEARFSEGGHAYFVSQRGELWSSAIHVAATNVLGLSVDEGLDLFAADNKREDVQRIAEGIAARAGERL